jgi:hypothetical protein
LNNFRNFSEYEKNLKPNISDKEREYSFLNMYLNYKKIYELN